LKGAGKLTEIIPCYDIILILAELVICAVLKIDTEYVALRALPWSQ